MAVGRRTDAGGPPSSGGLVNAHPPAPPAHAARLGNLGAGMAAGPLLLGWFVVRAVVFAVVFALVFGLVDQRRTVELTHGGVTASDVWRQRSSARTDVRPVSPVANGGTEEYA